MCTAQARAALQQLDQGDDRAPWAISAPNQFKRSAFTGSMLAVVS